MLLMVFMEIYKIQMMQENDEYMQMECTLNLILMKLVNSQKEGLVVNPSKMHQLLSLL